MRSLDLHLSRSAPSLPIAFVRIGMGVTGMIFALFTHRDLTLLLQNDVLKFPLFPGFPLLPLPWLPLYTLLGFAASVTLTAGAFTSISAVTLAACILYRHLADWSLYQNFTALLGIFVILLIPARAGARLSLDAWRVGTSPSWVPLWPQTLMKFQLSAVYFYTALVKCNPDFLRGDIFRERLGLTIPFAPLLTIAFEFFLAIALWVPRLRRPAILLGSVFHFGMLVALGFYAALIGFFVEFLSIYILFWTTPDTSTERDTDAATSDSLPLAPGTAVHPNSPPGPISS